jgi:hypothetical protein
MAIEDRTINYKVFDKYGKQIDYFTINKVKLELKNKNVANS